MSFNEVRESYLSEMKELLESVESSLLELEREPEKRSSIDTLFRYFHTIKGSSEMFGYNHIGRFTHTAESNLDRLRSGDSPITAEQIEILLESRDHIEELLEVECEQYENSPALKEKSLDLIRQMEQRFGSPSVEGVAAPEKDGSTPEKPPSPAGEGPQRAGEEGETLWNLDLRFQPDLFRHGLDPLPFLRYLKTFGSIREIETLLALPAEEKFDPESCHLSFRVRFESFAPESKIRENFEFMSDDLFLEITSSSLHTPGGERTPSVSPPSRTKPSVSPPSAGGEAERAASVREGEQRRGHERESRTFRVDSDRIDRLINMVGELLITGARINELSQKEGDGELREAVYQLNRTITEIRESTMRLRMVPVGGIFNRFHRVVHDLSKELHKEVRLEILGAETELDKTVIEKISDPLTHLVRNAIDHGIEDSGERVRSGKREPGRLTLNAFHEAGEMVIEVSDDGRGMNSDRIRQKAVERGLLSESRIPHESELFAIVFEPGFSTARSVSHVSGRGVGLDVVKRNIESLRGAVELHSTMGAGTTIKIKIPLTLASMEGFLVGVGGMQFVVSLDIVVECIEYRDELVHDRDYIALREEILPFIRMRELFELNGNGQGEKQHIVIVRNGEQKVGLVVDRLMGEMQSVIKPLGVLFKEVNILGGSTILGNGRVALILDVPALIRLVERNEEQQKRRVRSRRKETTEAVGAVVGEGPAKEADPASAAPSGEE